MYKLVFSVTTIPSRINNLWMALNSMLYTQTVNPDRIIVNIPYKSLRFDTEYIIPDNLKLLHADNIIEINRCEDYGPGTKLLGLFNHPKIDDDTLIFVFDDDRVYPNIVEYLLDAYNKNPGTTIGSVTGMIEKHRVNNYGYFIQGYSGYLTQKKFFTDDIFECAKLNIRYCDDHYLSYHILKNNYKIFGLENSNREWNVYVPGKTDSEFIDSLCRIENSVLESKKLIEECNKYYKERYDFDIEEYKKSLEIY